GGGGSRSGCRRARAWRSYGLLGEVQPQALQAVRDTEQRAEVCGVDQQDVAGPGAARGKPEERVELPVPRSREGVRPRQVDRLPGQDMDGLRVLGRQRVVRQVGVEVERGDPREEAARIE